MAYVAPTPSDFQARFPNFGSVDAGIVLAALGRAARVVNVSWADADRLEGVLLYTAHELTLDGLGASAESQANAGGAGGFKSISSGGFSLTRFDQSGADQGLGATAYGKRFRDLAMRLGGPIAVVLNNRAV